VPAKELLVLGLKLQMTEKEVSEVLFKAVPPFKEVSRAWSTFDVERGEVVAAKKGNQGAYLSSIGYERRLGTKAPHDTDRLLVQLAAPPAESRVIVIDRQTTYEAAPTPWEDFSRDLVEQYGEPANSRNERTIDRHTLIWATKRPPDLCLDMMFFQVTNRRGVRPYVVDCTPNVAMTIDHPQGVVRNVRTILNDLTVTIGNEQKHEAYVRSAGKK